MEEKQKFNKGKMTSYRRYVKYVVYLIIISTIIRGLLAGLLELGNDEVYYRLYALFPDWSHFDHPPMIGILMQITTIDMLFQNEFFLRLGAVIIGAVNIWLVFKIGNLIKDARTGYYASLLYVSSIYASVITGVFILPDTPQSLFWLMALLIMLQTVPKCPNQPMIGLNFLKLSVILGLGILSKYTTIFLWLGIALYILAFNREWLKKKWLYMGVLISVIVSLPILIWNINNDFISINFHSERVDMSGRMINIDYFLSELFGELLYNNPIVYILLLIAIVAGFRGNLRIEKSHFRLMILAGLPIVITFLIFSLFRRTLPHWTAPGITGMIPLAAVYLCKSNNELKRIPIVISSALLMLILVVLVGFIQINTGFVSFGQTENASELGRNDPSLDMFGYRETGEKFADIVKSDIEKGIMDKNSVLIGNKWFPLANYEYYAARPMNMNVLALGSLEDIHKYEWINKERGGFQLGMDAYYLTNSRLYNEPGQIFYEYFNKIAASDTIIINRNGQPAINVFVYRLKDLQKIPDSKIN